jgi:hypothetical protein
MYKEFSHIDELIEWVKYDKNIAGSLAPTANRYPIRFVLFDNFRDSFDFVSIMQEQFNCHVESVNNWIDEPYCDAILTHSKLAERMINFVEKATDKDKDYVITPFSELARFYDNNLNFEFNSLISTVKGIEASQEAISNNQRIYVPIVGLEGKFSKFTNDSQIVEWYFKNNDKQLNYRLVITDNTSYNVQGLSNKFTIVNDMQEWLKVWRNKNAKQEIISLSPSIFANAEYAQPDNAFTFRICDNVYKFLTDGLKLNFGAIAYNPDDEEYWLRLASEIDINNFSFEAFFNNYFQIPDLANYNVFLKTWFDCKNNFEKWLLINYYTNKFCEKGYICQAIRNLNSFADYDFFAVIALAIFDDENSEEYLEERNVCLQQASKKQIPITNEVQNELSEKLKILVLEKGYATAIRYFSPLTNAEKSLAISWLGNGFISKNDILAFFPDLYNYLGKSTGTNESSKKWALNYIDLYKQCKVSNNYSDELKNLIEEKNASPIAFNQWYQSFKTIKTILNSRSDIEIYYWIDGLGIDWIPYITEYFSKEENIFLNEVFIARSILPTTTSINKVALLDLSNNQLQKIGDLDEHAHKQGNKYPNFILEEFEIVKNAIQEILNKYAGKKIAIVSDHGLTALSQLREGLNLAGVESDHYGRFARRISGKVVTDTNYIVLDDNETMCALHHESLCGKIPTGQSAHGGCTPEEVLVPLFVISSKPNASNYSASLLTQDVSGTNPIVKYTIKGLSISDTPYLMYNGRRYELNNQDETIYFSDRLNLVANENMIELCIGSYIHTSKINISLGAEDDNDLFDF